MKLTECDLQDELYKCLRNRKKGGWTDLTPRRGSLRCLDKIGCRCVVLESGRKAKRDLYGFRENTLNPTFGSVEKPAADFDDFAKS